VAEEEGSATDARYATLLRGNEGQQINDDGIESGLGGCIDRREAGATSFVGSAAKQVNDQRDDGENQEQVNEKTRDVVDEESASPKQE
jgi:hypothetical protein